MKMKRHFLFFGILGALLGAAGATWWRFEDLKHDPALYRSLAKLVVLHPAEPVLKLKGENPDFYGTCIETIESAEMARRARERLLETNPDLTDSSSYAFVRGVRSKGSGIIAVLATGNDGQHTQEFLNAILDEFIEFRRAVHEAHFGRLIGRLETRHQEAGSALELARQAHQAAWDAPEVLLGGKEVLRQEERLLKLRNESDELTAGLRTAAGKAENEQTAAKLEVLRDLIKESEQSLRKTKRSLESFEMSLRSIADVERRRMEAGARVEEARREAESFTDVIAVQERSTTATAHMPEPAEALAAAAILGALGGGSLFFGLAWITTLRPKTKAQLE